MESTSTYYFPMAYSQELHSAILSNDHKRIEHVLQYVSELNTQYYGSKSTPLRHAILQCNPDIVDILLKRGASPNHKLDDGLTAFHYAVRTYGPSIRCNNLTGKLRVLLKLLRGGAKLDEIIVKDLEAAYYKVEGIYLKDFSTKVWSQSVRPGTPLQESLEGDLYM